jgi:hypothetical protein
MLPSNLLIATFLRGKIRPTYAPLSKEMLQLVDRLSGSFRGAVGQRKETMYGELENLETDGRFDYRLIRGLAVLLMRRCVFESSSRVDARTARRSVFTLAAQVGVPTTPERRREIIRKAAEELKITSEDLEKSLWSDFDENLRLKQFDPLDGYALIRYYNLGLTQTLLFKAVNVDFTIRKGNYKNIFRAIKRLRLMYFAETLGGDTFRISVEGPMSLVKMTEKYGTSVAKLLPAILQSEYWKIRAGILRRGEGFPRVFAFELERGEVKDQLEASNQVPATTTQLFDSGVEEKFWRDFTGYGSGWTIQREPEPLVTSSGTVMIPDFSFEKDGSKVYLEIVGFWTTQYLEKKLEKLRQLSIPNMIVAVDKKLATSRKFSGLPADVVFFERSVPLKPIVDRLKKIESDALSRELSKVSNIELKLEGDVIELKDISHQNDVSIEALMKHIEEKPQVGYVKIGDQLVSEKLVKKVEAKLQTLGKRKTMTLSETSELIGGFGIRSPQAILNLLGYRITWHGIEPSKAEISKETQKPSSGE